MDVAAASCEPSRPFSLTKSKNEYDPMGTAAGLGGVEVLSGGGVFNLGHAIGLEALTDFFGAAFLTFFPLVLAFFFGMLLDAAVVFPLPCLRAITALDFLPRFLATFFEAFVGRLAAFAMSGSLPEMSPP